MEFVEGHVEAGGLRIRCLEAGEGAPLVHLHGAGGLRLTAAHELLAQRFRVIALDGPLPVAAAASLGLERYNLLGSADAGEAALRLALREPERVSALVLEAPAAPDPELEPRLRRLGTPTLVLFGTRDRAAPELGRRYKQLLPNSHLVFVYDAGHRIAADRPEAFAEVVIDFLDRHEAFVISRKNTVIHP